MPTIFETFVPGGVPGSTYNPRPSTGLEQRLRNYLKAPNSLLSISGPTKIGKTVLLKHILGDQDYLDLEGGQIRTEDDVWQQLAHQLGLYENEEVFLSSSDDGELSGEAGVGFMGIGAKGSATSKKANSRGRTQTRALPIIATVVDAVTDCKRPLVIDDFHYIPTEIQQSIIRAFRPALQSGSPVVVISVPNRSQDAINAEPDMIGRTTNLPVPPWSVNELERIAQTGFAELGLHVDEQIQRLLAREASGNPQLMQEFCRELCIANGHGEEVPEGSELELTDESEFFTSIAVRSAISPEFYRMMDGLTTRGKGRTKYRLLDPHNPGQTSDVEVDLYQLVLMTIVQLSRRNPIIRFRQIRDAVSGIIDGNPRKNQYTDVLKAFDKIASESGGAPSVEWNPKDEIFVVQDPFFAFFCRWAVEASMRGLMDLTGFFPLVPPSDRVASN